jgi:four helix bundle protein
MSKHRNLAVADAAEQLAAAVTRLSDRTRRLLHRQQLLKAAQSVSANIAEGFARSTLPDRNSRLVIARGEAEESIRHLRANLTSKRITPGDYWPLHNRAVTIVKMLIVCWPSVLPALRAALTAVRTHRPSELSALWNSAPFGTPRLEKSRERLGYAPRYTSFEAIHESVRALIACGKVHDAESRVRG